MRYTYERLQLLIFKQKHRTKKRMIKEIERGLRIDLHKHWEDVEDELMSKTIFGFLRSVKDIFSDHDNSSADSDSNDDLGVSGLGEIVEWVFSKPKPNPKAVGQIWNELDRYIRSRRDKIVKIVQDRNVSLGLA